MAPVAGTREERERICSALVEQVAERGYRWTSVDHVMRRAGLEQEVFGRHFESLEECFLVVWNEIDRELERRMSAAFGREDEWQDALRGALVAGLGYLAGDECRARLFVSEARLVSEPLRERQRAALARLSSMIDRGRRQGSPAPPHIAEAISGAIWHRVEMLVGTGKVSDLPAEVPQLMYFAVLPYRGSAAGEAELGRPPGR